MSDDTLQPQSISQQDNAINSIRSRKLREFLLKKPSFLRSLTPEGSYSMISEFQKSTPMSIELLGFENIDISKPYKNPIAIQQQGPRLEERQQTATFPCHKISRSRSIHELEQLMERSKEEDLFTDLTTNQYSTNPRRSSLRQKNNDIVKHLPIKEPSYFSLNNLDTKLYPNKGLTRTELTEPKENSQDFTRGRLPNRISDIFASSTARTTHRENVTNQHDHTEMTSKELFKDNLANNTKSNAQSKANFDDVKEKKNLLQKEGQVLVRNIQQNRISDSSIGNIIDMMGSNPNIDGNKPFDMDGPFKKEGEPLSPIASDGNNTDHNFAPDYTKDVPLSSWAKPASSFIAQSDSADEAQPTSPLNLNIATEGNDLTRPKDQQNMPLKLKKDIDKGVQSKTVDLVNKNFTSEPPTRNTDYQTSPEMIPKTQETSDKLISTYPQNLYLNIQGQPNLQISAQTGNQTYGPLSMKNRQPTFDPMYVQADYASSIQGASPTNTLGKVPNQSIMGGIQQSEGLTRLLDPIQEQQTNMKLNTTTTFKGEVVGQSNICRFHPNNLVGYICVKENCGELLCPLCLYEHQKNKHIGEYETISTFTSDIKQRLTQTQKTFSSTFEQLNSLQDIINDKTKFDLEIVEEISRIEANLIKNVRQFFDSLREEFSKDFFFEYQKTTEDITHLHNDLNSVIQALEDDLTSISKEVSTMNPHVLTRIVQKDYINSSTNYKKTLGTLEGQVKHFINLNQEIDQEKKLVLEANPRLTSKLIVLLTESVRIKEKFSSDTIEKTAVTEVTGRMSQSKSAKILPQTTQNKSFDPILEGPAPEKKDAANEEKPRIEEKEEKKAKEEKQKEKVEQDIKTAKNIEERKEVHQPKEEDDSHKRPRTLSPWKGNVASNTVNITRMINPGTLASNANTLTQKGVKNYFDTKKLSDNITTKILEIYSPAAVPKTLGDRDLDVSLMKFLLEYMERFYNSGKIRVLDPSFFQRLFNMEDIMDFSDFGRKDLFFEKVADDLQAGMGKGKCIFTSCEKVFMLGRIQASQWILVEVRSSPKAIILYDFLGKLQKSKFSENMFGLVLEIIRREYNTKLGQNVENYLWEKKVATQPVLIVKNTTDTGILALKVISNCYQNKEFTTAKITINEISLTRKKIDKILKIYEEKKTHDKFTPI